MNTVCRPDVFTDSVSTEYSVRLSQGSVVSSGLEPTAPTLSTASSQVSAPLTGMCDK